MSIFGESITVKPLHMKLGAHNCEKNGVQPKTAVKMWKCRR